MDKSFIIKSKTSGTCYCGNCGVIVWPNQSLFSEHIQNKKCGPYFDGTDVNYVVEEKGCLGYYLDNTQNSLLLFVCTPQFKQDHVSGDQIKGMEWVPVYIAEFPVASKCPITIKNSYGMELEDVLAKIKCGRIFPIRNENDLDVLQRVFPCIDIFSLQMFAHIYRNKGFNATESIGSGMEKWLLEKRLRNKDWKNFGVDLKGKASRGRKQVPIPVYAAIYQYHKEKTVQFVMNIRGSRL